MPFVNIVYNGTRTEIKTDGMKDISELQDAIKAEYSNAIVKIDAPQLQLYKSYSDKEPKADALITKMEEIPEEYFKEVGEGGLFLEIRTLPPPSKQSSRQNIVPFHIVPFPPKSGAFLEGLPESSEPRIDRSALVKRISDTVDAYYSLLITSPSFTGKTTLANLIYNHWQQRGKSVHYISFAFYRPGVDLEQYFMDLLGQDVFRIMRTDGYLIMDSTQNIYSDPHFWGCLKSGFQVRRVLAFGDFGLASAGNDRSPYHFQLKWSYDDIKFSDEECMELVESFKQHGKNASEILTPEILGDLFPFLNNHPGLVYLALHTLCYEFTHNARGITDMRPRIANGDLRSELHKARCFGRMTYESIMQMLGAKTDRVMQMLITNDSIPLEDGVLDLHRSGICIADRTESTLKFSSEMMRFFYRDLYYKAKYGVGGSR